jgi:uncharacterized protein (DUF1800 family)
VALLLPTRVLPTHMITPQKKVRHLFLRAGFGATPQQFKELNQKSIGELVDSLFESSVLFSDLDYIPDPTKGKKKEVSNFQLLAMIIRSRNEMMEMNFQWLYRMATTSSQLREKMTFFWHNHFATSVPLSFLMQEQNNLLRQHSLGSFRDLLHAISKDPAMIIYLNNQENHKDAPNENFAREVMELFTLGEGHYTEHDIKEAARAFTGWEVNRKGKFEFKEADHDSGEKEFMGRKGNFNGDDIINILLENKQTAKFIVTKIYREFVNQEIDETNVNSLSDQFYKSGYDISYLMKSIFNAEWFYDDINIGNKIISPVEFLVRYIKLMRLEFENAETLVDLQKTLGQTLFFPPNVAGWKGGTNWIDSSSLLLRMNFPKMILEDNLDIHGKPEPEETSERKLQNKNKVEFNVDWSDLVNAFSKTNSDQLVDEIINELIQSKTVQVDKKLISSSSVSLEKIIRNTIVKVMSLPEYQLI